MNETLEKTLEVALQKAIVLAERTGEFVIEQGTDLLKEFYMWHTALHIFWVVFGLLVIVAGIAIPKIWGKKEYFETEGSYGKSHKSIKFLCRYYNDDEGIASAIIIMTLGSIAGLSVLLTHLYNLLYIYIAPKLYLIEYFIK